MISVTIPILHDFLGCHVRCLGLDDSVMSALAPFSHMNEELSSTTLNPNTYILKPSIKRAVNQMDVYMLACDLVINLNI